MTVEVKPRRLNPRRTMYTNKHVLHPVQVLAVVLGDQLYDLANAGHLSASHMANPIQQLVLTRAHEDDIIQDISNLSFAFFGTAVHEGLQNLFDLEPFIAEQRYRTNINDWEITAKIDLVAPVVPKDLLNTAPIKFTSEEYLNWYRQSCDPGKVELINWKVTSVFAVKPGRDHLEWRRQAAVERFCFESQMGKGLEVSPICMYFAFLRDWSWAALQRERTYPSCPFGLVELDTATVKEDGLKDWVTRRVHATASAVHDYQHGETLPKCSEKEQWRDPARTAVMKKGKARAVKLFDSEFEAARFLEEQRDSAQLYIEDRPAIPTKCDRYCDAGPYCAQRDEEKLDAK